MQRNRVETGRKVTPSCRISKLKDIHDKDERMVAMFGLLNDDTLEWSRKDCMDFLTELSRLKALKDRDMKISLHKMCEQVDKDQRFIALVRERLTQVVAQVAASIEGVVYSTGEVTDGRAYRN